MKTQVRSPSRAAYATRRIPDPGFPIPVTTKRPLPSASTTVASQRVPGVRLRTALFAAGASAGQVHLCDCRNLECLGGSRLALSQRLSFGVEESCVDVTRDK